MSASDIHPVIILSDISFIDIQCIIEFIYRGELNVSGVEQFMSVLKVAEELRIKGLMEVSCILSLFNIKLISLFFSSLLSTVHIFCVSVYCTGFRIDLFSLI